MCLITECVFWNTKSIAWYIPVVPFASSYPIRGKPTNYWYFSTNKFHILSESALIPPVVWYVVVIARCRVQYEEYFPSFSTFFMRL